MSKTTNKFAPEVRERAVRMVFDHERDHPRTREFGTLVERTTRFTMLLHLPRMEGHDTSPLIKNGPALAGHGAEAVRDAITRTIATLPGELRRSLIWNQGAEKAQQARLKVDSGVQVYFCDPQSPWQRGTNENTNGLLRQYFSGATEAAKAAGDTEIEKLHAKIGQLVVERDFLSKGFAQ